MQYLETEIENNPNIIKDIHTLHDMAKLFGIKKFYKILTDPEPLSSKIRKEGNIFVCIACNKNYKNEPGIKYHVNGKCPKNIASYKCLLCNFEVIETAKIECRGRDLGNEFEEKQMNRKGFGEIGIKFQK